jgi:WD40 repeat protein/tetratricopeptide (TPR) repeat protein
MNDTSDLPLTCPMPPDVERRLNRACDAFEAAWRAGHRPAIEDYLFGAAEGELGQLLAELLLLEVHYRRLAGEEPAAAEYQARFPALAAHRVEAALQRREGREKAPASLPVVPGYEIEAELGHGGMGVVYRARQLGLDRIVALKMIRAGEHPLPEELARFHVEGEAVARLSHPNIVQVFEVGTHAGRPFLCMEYVEGGSLAQRVRGSTQPPREAAALVEVLARAVHHAHQRHVIHRDLKPGNVLLAADGTPKVADFGLARRLDGEDGHTRTGAVLGTPAYMAPEQAAGERGAVGPAADVYALGAILYELLAGRPPFLADTPLEALLLVRQEEPVPPRRLRRGLSRDLETVCLKCLEKDPRRRYASALALADDLRSFGEGRPITARPVGFAGRAWRWCRRNPAVASLLALLLLAVGGGLAAVTWKWLEADFHEGQARQQADLAERNALAERVAKEEAQDVSRQLQKSLYRHEIALGYHEWHNGNPRRAQQIVANCRPEYRGWEWRYLHRLCHSARLTLRGHDLGLLAVAFSPDGTRIAAASGQWGLEKAGEVIVWDAHTGQELPPLKGHTRAIVDLAFSPDSRWLASASLDRTACVWEVASGRKRARCSGHRASVRSLAFGPDGRLATGSSDGTLKVWDAATGKEQRTITPQTGEIMAVAFSPNGRWLASGGKYPYHIKLWNARTGKAEKPLDGHRSDLRSLAFSPDSTRLASGSWDTQIMVWNVESARPLYPPLYRHTDVVTQAVFSPDGHTLASASHDGTVRLWNADTGAELRTLRAHTGEVSGVAFSPDGERLVSSGLDRVVHVWDVMAEQDSRNVRFPGHPHSLAFSSDGRLLAGADGSPYYNQNKTIRILDTATGLWLRTLHGHTGRVLGVAFCPGRPHLASASTDKTVRVWDVAGRGLLHLLQGHTDAVHGVAFSPDGQLLASAAADRTARLWDAVNGKLLRIMGEHTGGLTGVAFSPDGQLLATAAADRTVRLWNVADRAPPRVLAGHTDAVNGVAFSPDGRHLASAGADHTLIVWEATSGQQVFVLRGHTDAVVGLAYNRGGDRLASVSHFDRTLRIWDTATGQQVLSLRNDQVLSVAFSPDGERLVTGASYENLKFWETAPAQPDGPWQRLAWFRHHAGHNQWDKAEAALTLVRRKRPEDADLFLGVANVHGELKQWDRAEPALDRALQLRPTDALIWQERGQRLSAQRQWDQATAAFDRAVQQGMDDPQLHRARGICHANRRRWDRAVADYTLALKVAPSGPTRASRAACLAQLGRLDEAVADYTEAIRLGPADVFLRWSRGRALAKLGRLDEALADYTQELRGQQNNPLLWQERADCYAGLKQWARAAADLAQACQCKPDAPARWHARAVAQLAAQDTDGYRKSCATLIARFGKSDNPAANWAVWTCILLPDAVTDFTPLVRLDEQVLAKHPRNWYFLTTLGAALYRAGRFEEATRKLDEACKAHGNGGNAYNWLFLAMAQHRLGNANEGRRWLAKSSEWLESARQGKIKDKPISIPLNWKDHFSLNLLLREAEALATDR